MTAEFPNIPGYKIEKRLGQGGMATVYLAVQESFGRHVALKIMSEALGEDDVWAKRFIKEAQIVAQLSHPNIVPVFDVGTYEGRFYISMECMKGGDLEGKMATGISIPEVLKIIVGVAAGLDFAGEKGFVHRDIKPDNVMFREDGSPVILDFGIVKQKGGDNDKMTKTGTIVGTTAYMSPEQAQGKELDERSDIYSLGCMMFELLTGRTPYQGDSAVAVLLKHVNEPPPQLPDFIAVLQPVLDKAMAKNVNERYGRAREMIEHLQELEPEIKAVLAQQQAMFSSAGAEEATGVMSAVNNDDATVATNALTQVQPEADLTQVLSSAKATIADFSEESRLRKARRTKGAFAVAALLVVLALGYAGVYQFYIVPKNLAKAEEQRQQRITTLVQEAQTMSSGLRYSDFNAMDKLIAKYQQVLQLDPDNSTAKATLQNLGEKYVSLAGKAIAQQDLKTADKYAAYAERLAPEADGLGIVRESIQTVRAASAQQELESQFKQQQIASLLEDAKADIAEGKTFLPDGNNAYATLQQILKLNAGHEEAKQLVNQLLQDLYTETGDAINDGSLRSAATKLELLERYYDDKGALAILNENYQQAKSRANKQARLANLQKQQQSLLSKAASLKRERRSVSINDQMRDLYLEVLDIDAGNREAQQGMEDTSAFEASLAQQAIANREFRRAGQNLALIEQHTPRYSELSSLKGQLNQAQKAAAQADDMLGKADQLLNTGGSGSAHLDALQNAYNYIDGAKSLDNNNPGITNRMAALESEYVMALTQLLAAKEMDTAKAYFDAAAGKPWLSDRILQLQLTQQSARQEDKPKPKRVLTGGF